jgi:4-alpha-glucanotransferase
MSIKENIAWNNLPRRAGGLLLHPTSLPGEFGIGELSKHVYKFIDILYENNLKLWQILPLGPTGYGNSPYSCFSAFAGNPFLISIQDLVDLGLINNEKLNSFRELHQNHIDFGNLIPMKWKLLLESFNTYCKGHNEELSSKFEKFKKENDYWLENFSIFMSIKESMNGAPWTKWKKQLRQKSNNSIIFWKKNNSNKIEFQKFVQFIFYKQWHGIRSYAKKKGIYIIGDLPIYVAHDSADVWANKDYFLLNEKGNPTFVSGVPPDEFTDLGQRWGNPLYDWEYLKQEKYSWWIKRLNFAFSQVDIVRIDHFRGFEAYWKIPVSETTAINGEWIKGPGKDFFKEIEKILGQVPLIAEDLGFMTQGVHDLREEFGYPGMKILQFDYKEMFGKQNQYLPKKTNANTVAYTGTHDNQTIISWFESISKKLQKKIEKSLVSDLIPNDLLSKFINFLWSHNAKYSIILMQDLLRMGDDSRLNTPGKESNNWIWRFNWDDLNEDFLQELKNLNKKYER